MAASTHTGGTTAVIFANQLFRDHPALKSADRVLMVESMARLTKRRYHVQKLVYTLSCMRHYAESLRANGWTVDYRQADSFTQAIRDHIAEYAPDVLTVVDPPEYEAYQIVGAWSEKFGVNVQMLTDDVCFTCPRETFLTWAKTQRGLLLERFYRWQRERLDLLMDGDQPAEGRWNYDEENRKPAATLPQAPSIPIIEPDAITSEVIDYVKATFPDNFGLADLFHYPVTHEQADRWLDVFIDQRLDKFGPWEDAMRHDDPFLFHGVMALLLNNGLLTPRQVALRVEAAYRVGEASIQSAEGFMRQIIGWREYVHGVYWLKMPEYADRNYFNQTDPLPEFFWTGKTHMRCMADTISTIQKHAYTHHIPRLMIVSNFANLAALSPQALTDWFLSVYIDAYDWVMQTNVLGLGLFADGGVMSTKPYIASASYISKMSAGYCPQCHYNPKQRTGEKACPFNTLYWDFLARNADKLQDNPRMAIMLRSAAQRPDLEEIQARAVQLRAAFQAGEETDL